MTGADGDGAYSLQSLQALLGITRGEILGFIREGFVTPSRGPRNSYRFGFQDVVLLRTAQGLRRADIPAARIRRSLKRLRALLPAMVPLSGLRISAVGDTVAIHEHGKPVAADSGQWLFDFEVALTDGAVLSFPVPATAPDEAAPPSPPTRLSTPATAAPLHDALRRGAERVDAGRPDEALAIFEAALVDHPDDADLQFNRAVVLEDVGRVDDAIDAYRLSIERRPDGADAHWNLARLYEARGPATLALRHFSAWRRLSR